MQPETRLSCYAYLRAQALPGTWAERILSELGFLLELSSCLNNTLDEKILPQLEALRRAFEANGAITKADALCAEQSLSELSSMAKAYEVICAAHAHIDMNWMWGFHETAGLTVDTFQTMLDLMREYPQFTFSQSQASVYRIIEQYAPQMLPEIRQRIHEGRWELTASSWVENDKNMSGGEAMARHILYTKRYLSRLFGISPDSLRLDFEPDTFGHAQVLPEIFQQGGIEYYYHCRGAKGPHIYNWEAPSGAQVLVYREPKWYNQTITPDLFLHVPSFCAEYNIPCYLKVYGVGDHGGGPTRRDIERILQMAEWPLFPTMRFGTLHEFFEKLSPYRQQFETVREERNYVFTGCYTSQSRIKRANRLGECRLNESEALDVMAKALCPAYQTPSPFEPAWQKILFNQFHDILPGSGVVETREYAMGEFQNAMTTAGINASCAMRALNAAINTSALGVEKAADTAYGAGVGYALCEADGLRFPAAERGSGSTRIMTVWNPSAFRHTGVFKFTLWDYPAPASRIYACDAEGQSIPIQVLEEGTLFWGHHFLRLAAKADISSMGWKTIVLRDKGATHVDIPTFPEPRTDCITDAPIVLENARLRAVFCPDTMRLTSLLCKESNLELIGPEKPGCILRLITESLTLQTESSEATGLMSAWRVGQYAKVEELNVSVPVHIDYVKKGALREEIGFHFNFRNSSLRAAVSLDAGSAALRFAFHVDWREFGSEESGIPQLNFQVPLAHPAAVSRCLSPMGFCDRQAIAQDVPCGGLLAVRQPSDAVALLSDCKYGFRNDGSSLSVTLIRSSYNPDPTPEIGTHTFTVALAVTGWEPTALLSTYNALMHPVSVLSNVSHEGALPMSGSLLTLSGAVLYAIKCAESGSGFILRLFNPEEAASCVTIRFRIPLCAASIVSILEDQAVQCLDIKDDTIRFTLPAQSMRSLLVQPDSTPKTDRGV